MSKSVSLVIILLTLVAFGSLASAQTKDTSCATPFSGGGSGIFQFNYCVSPNGNIVQMETPAGFQHLAPGHLSEGYGLCDVTRCAEPTRPRSCDHLTHAFTGGSGQLLLTHRRRVEPDRLAKRDGGFSLSKGRNEDAVHRLLKRIDGRNRQTPQGVSRKIGRRRDPR